MKPYELVKALKAMGLTQMEIQRRSGIPQPTVSKIFRGRVRDVMSRHYLALLAVYEHQLTVQPAPPASAPAPVPARAPTTFPWPRLSD